MKSAIALVSTTLFLGACSSQSVRAPIQPEDAAVSTSGATSALTAQAAPVRNATVDIVPFYGDIHNNPLTPASDPATLVYRIKTPAGPVPAGTMPVLAPDGHHVTLGEWVGVTGRASVKCINQGTHIVFHLSGLLPKGIYTAWLVVPNPHAPPPFLAVGSIGPNDGSQNVFYASASGEGELSSMTPAGPLSFVKGMFPACGLSLDEFHVVTAYHIDQKTYGPNPGNGPATFLEQGAFVFVQ